MLLSTGLPRTHKDNLTQIFAVFGKNLPQSQQCHLLLVGRLGQPKPFEFLDARRHTRNMQKTAVAHHRGTELFQVLGG